MGIGSGSEVGVDVGTKEGNGVGAEVGAKVGALVGGVVGFGVGGNEGRAVVGAAVVGVNVGAAVPALRLRSLQNAVAFNGVGASVGENVDTTTDVATALSMPRRRRSSSLRWPEVAKAWIAAVSSSVLSVVSTYSYNVIPERTDSATDACDARKP